MTNEGNMVNQGNVLFATDVSMFDVEADQSQGCAEFGLRGSFKLSLNSRSIKLFHPNAAYPLIEWDYFVVRSYGSSDHDLIIIVEKRSSTGEGCFRFRTMEGRKIVEIIFSHACQVIKKAVTAATLPRDKTTLNSLSSNSFSSFATAKPTSPAVRISLEYDSANAADSQSKNHLYFAIGQPPIPLTEEKRKLSEPKKSISNKSSNEPLSKKDVKNKKQEKEMKREAKERKKLEEKTQKKLERLKEGKGKGNAESNLCNELRGALLALLPINVEVDDDDDDELHNIMHASPIKINSGKKNKGNKNAPQIEVEEGYEDVSPFSAPIIPPKVYALGDDVYETPGNIYVLESTKSLESAKSMEPAKSLGSAKSLASNYESNPCTDLSSNYINVTFG